MAAMVDGRHSDHEKLSFVDFEDLKPGARTVLHSIAKHLAQACKPLPAKSAAQAMDDETDLELTRYIMALESKFAFGHRLAAKVEWPAMWAKVLSMAVSRGCRAIFKAEPAEKDQETADEAGTTSFSKINEQVAANLVKWLPQTNAVCPALMPGAPALPLPGQNSAVEVKKEQKEPNESTAGQGHPTSSAGVAAVASNMDSGDTVTMPSIVQVYCMHDLPNMQGKSIDARDVVAIRAQIELFLMSNAKCLDILASKASGIPCILRVQACDYECLMVQVKHSNPRSKSDENMLKSLVMDSKGNALLPGSRITESMQDAKVFGFGAVSTEQNQNSLKAVLLTSCLHGSIEHWCVCLACHTLLRIPVFVNFDK